MRIRSPTPRSPTFKLSRGRRRFVAFPLLALVIVSLWLLLGRSQDESNQPEKRDSPPEDDGWPPRPDWFKPNEPWIGFDEPDETLRRVPQPHTIGCDVPLTGEDAGKLLYMGFFSTAKGARRRDTIRSIIFPDLPPDEITHKFIIGRPRGEDAAELMESVRLENETHGDIVMLPIPENMDDGKTHSFLVHVAQTYAGPGRVKDRPRFVMKIDDDSFPVMPNIITHFRSFNCSENIYYGTMTGYDPHFPPYMRGIAYALSWPLAAWIGSAHDMDFDHTARIEDARTGQWLTNLNPETDPVKWVDLGWMMADWDRMDDIVETTLLHWIKHDAWFEHQHARIHRVWLEAGRKYTPENGVPLEQVLALSQVQPKGDKFIHCVRDDDPPEYCDMFEGTDALHVY